MTHTVSEIAARIPREISAAVSLNHQPPAKPKFAVVDGGVPARSYRPRSRCHVVRRNGVPTIIRHRSPETPGVA